MSVITLLQQLGLLPAIFQKDLDDAAEEDVMRTAVTHEQVRNQATASEYRNHCANATLHDAVSRVRSVVGLEGVRGRSASQ